MEPNHSYGQYLRPPAQPAGPQPTLHSGVGITSFVMSLLGGVGTLVGLVLAAMMVAKQPNISDEAPETVAVGMVIVFLGLLTPFIGLILGIAGCVQKDRKKVFAILGTVFNAVILLGVGALLALGLAVS